MFNFFQMAANYSDRKVGRFEKGELLVSTICVSDSEKSYETAVAHPKYNNGDIVIVEDYDSRNEALVGHEKWIKIMTGKKLPEKLTDVSTYWAASLIRNIEKIKNRC